MTPEQIAHVVHEANRAVQIEQADPTIPISARWEDLDAETKASAVDGVLAVQGGATPEQSHENWCAFKVAHGWTLGPVKDETTKQHPLLVSYAELPEAQQVKDHLFSAIVHALSQVSDRCPATSKRTGEQCGQYLPIGAVVCRWHGGGAAQVEAKADDRRTELEARADLAKLGVPVETTPIEALEAMLCEAAGNVAALRLLVWELPDKPSVQTNEDGTPYVDGGIYGPDHKGDGKAHVLVTMYDAERDRLARIAKDCAALGLDERRVKVAEAQTERLFTAVSKALDAIPADAREGFRVALAAELRRPALAAS